MIFSPENLDKIARAHLEEIYGSALVAPKFQRIDQGWSVGASFPSDADEPIGGAWLFIDDRGTAYRYASSYSGSAAEAAFAADCSKQTELAAQSALPRTMRP